MTTKIEKTGSLIVILCALLLSTDCWSNDLIRIGILTPSKHSRVTSEDVRSCFLDAIDDENYANVQFAFESTGGSVLGTKKAVQRLMAKNVDFVVLMVNTQEAIEAGVVLAERKVPYLSLANEYKVVDKEYGFSLFNSEISISRQIVQQYFTLPSVAKHVVIVYDQYDKTLVTKLKQTMLEAGLDAEIHRFNVHASEDLERALNPETAVFVFTKSSLQTRVVNALGKNHKGRVLVYPSDNDLPRSVTLSQPLYEISYLNDAQIANPRLKALIKTHCKRVAIDERFVYRLDAVISAIHLASSLAGTGVNVAHLKGKPLEYQSLIDSEHLRFNERGFADRNIIIRRVSNVLPANRARL